MTTIKKYIALSMCVFIIGFTSLFGQQDTITTSVYFETAKADLTPIAQQSLRQLSKQLQQYSDYTIDIAAHTDERGTSSYNNQLATDRSKAVEEYLSELDLNIDNLRVINFGENKQDFDNSSEATRQFNRRVDIVVTPIKWNNLEVITEELKENTKSNFTIKTSTPSKIIGKEGTTIWISPNTFEFSDGQIVTGEVNITLTESLSYGAMISNGLFTTSGGKLLETGGMIKIEASVDGQPLQLKEDADIMASIPTSSFDKRMQLFYGATHATDSTLADWLPVEQKPKQTIEANLVFAPKPIPPIKKTITWSIPDDLLPKLPQAPKSYNYHSLTLPKRDAIRYNPPLLKKFFMSKKKLAAIKEKMYQDQLNRYYQRKRINEIRQEKYERALAMYKVCLENYYTEWERLKEEQAAFKNRPETIAAQAKQDSIYQIALIKYNKELAQWKKYKAKKLEAFEAEYEQKGSMTNTDMENYIFKVTQLGWINIDVFYNKAATIGTLELAGLPTTDISTFLVFKSINSVIRINPNEAGEYKTKNLPIGLNAEIVAIKVQNGQALLAAADITIQKEQTVDLTFQPTRLKDIRAYMEGLN